MVRQRSALIALRTFSRFSSFRQVEGRLDLGWSSHDISPPLKLNTTRTLESYLKLLVALKEFQQLTSLTENKTPLTLFVVYYQPL